MAATTGKKIRAKVTRTRRPRTRAKRAPSKKPKGAKDTGDGDLVRCGTHGETRATFVCRHVARGVACGFHAKAPTRANPWPDAWCDLCETAFQAGGGEWNEQNEGAVDIQLLCTHCYERARARNVEVPRLARGSGGKLTAEEAAELVRHAVHAAQALQVRSDKKWRWQHMSRWDFDAASRTLTFAEPARASVVADVQLVGSYSMRSHTFQWAWATLGEEDREAEAISRLRVFGEVRGIDELATPNWECDETTGWEMTALAALVLGASGVYRAPMNGDLYWFMLLSNWRTEG